MSHAAMQAAWERARAGGKLHHAWLLHGPQGVGKGKFAHQAAYDLVGGKWQNSGDQLHPDVVILTREAANDTEKQKQLDGKPFQLRRNITVDQVRAVLRRLITKPSQGDMRAIIVDSADDLERGAANALLKMLEEPPAGNVFFLISHRPGRLLPTIRSRCRQLGFATPDASLLTTAIAEQFQQVSIPERTAMERWGGGTLCGSAAIDDHGLLKAVTLMDAIAHGAMTSDAASGPLAQAVDPRMSREAVDVLLACAQRIVADVASHAEGPRRIAALDVYNRLVTLQLQAPIANFDSGLLITQIGNLLASISARNAQALNAR